jgi:hypothetical protein
MNNFRRKVVNMTDFSNLCEKELIGIMEIGQSNSAMGVEKESQEMKMAKRYLNLKSDYCDKLTSNGLINNYLIPFL